MTATETSRETERRHGSRIGKYLFDVSTLPSDAVLAWRLEGWRGVWAEIRERTVFRVYRSGRYLIVYQELSSCRPCPAPPGVRITRVEPDEWTRLGEIVGRRKLVRYRENAVRGRVCLAAWRGEAPIGYGWFSDRIEPDVEGYPPPLKPDAAYLWDLYVIPRERNTGVGSALVSARLEYARENGFRTAWRMISPRNTASLRTLEKTSQTGARVIGTLHYRKGLNRARIQLEPTDDAAESPTHSSD